MNPLKKYLRFLYSSQISPIDKLKQSKNLFIDRTAYIFAAGPSLNKIIFNRMAHELENNLVLCIKQSYEKVGLLCDSMILNLCNYQNYDWDNFQCPVIWAAFEDDHRDIFLKKKVKQDFIIDVYDNRDNNGKFDKTIAKRLEWERLLEFSESKACWGPGLMYEVAIPYALHLGVNNIVLVAWDIGIQNNNKECFQNDHFYANTVEIPTAISNEEISLVSDSSGDLRRWLLKQNVNISIVSNQSSGHHSIPRDLRWLDN